MRPWLAPVEVQDRASLEEDRRFKLACCATPEIPDRRESDQIVTGMVHLAGRRGSVPWSSLRPSCTVFWQDAGAMYQ